MEDEKQWHLVTNYFGESCGDPPLTSVQAPDLEDIKDTFSEFLQILVLGNFTDQPLGPPGQLETQPLLEGRKWKEVNSIIAQLTPQRIPNALTSVVNHLLQQSASKALGPLFPPIVQTDLQTLVALNSKDVPTRQVATTKNRNMGLKNPP